MSRKEYIPKHDKEKKQKFHLPLSAWLSYLVLATLLFGSVSLARYTASTADGDGARVAKFEVSANGNDGQTDKITLSTTTLNAEAYTFTVKNTSEVAVKYTIIVKNVPVDVHVSINNSEFLTPNGEGTVTYEADNVLRIDNQAECTIAFKACDAYTEAKEYEKKITIEVRFDQVD